jgi:hypothetical protein
MLHVWTSADGATIRATRTGGSLFPRQWFVSGTEAGAECGAWHTEECDGGQDASDAIRWLLGRMRYPIPE